jgi:hypothetical protein
MPNYNQPHKNLQTSYFIDYLLKQSSVKVPEKRFCNVTIQKIRYPLHLYFPKQKKHP